MNRIFPGNPDGQFSEQAADLLLREIVTHSEYLIDIHSGGAQLISYNWCLYSCVKPNEESRQLAKAFGFEVILPSKSEMLAKALFRVAADKGIKSILVESGGGTQIVEETADTVNMNILNVMKNLGMIDGAPRLLDKYTFLSEYLVLTSERGGIFRSRVKVGQRIAEGETIAVITDIFGEKNMEVSSPIDGVILAMRTHPIVRTGSWTFEVGRFA